MKARKFDTSNKPLRIKWQRLVYKGKTCPRCDSTRKEIAKAVKILKNLGINVVLEKEKLTVSKFKKNPLESNRIWINEKPLEVYIQAQIGSSPCCDVCGPAECRTIDVQDKIYETIPAELIVQAALSAVAQTRSCCSSR